MKPSLTVMTLGVEDPEATHAFFSGGLGWAAALYDPDEVVFYQVGPGLLLSFFRRDLLAAEAGTTAPAATAPVTLGHNVDSPGAVDTVLAEAAAAGGGRSSRRGRSGAGEATRVISRILTVSGGRWPGTQGWSWTTTDRSASRSSDRAAPDRRAGGAAPHHVAVTR